MECKCCHQTFDEFATDSVCDYCEFENIETLDDVGVILKLAEAHRKDVLSKLHDLSIKANVYQWNTTANQYEQKGQVELFNPKLDGSNCYTQQVFGNQWIAHFEGMAEIKVEYIFGGAEKAVSAQVQFEPEEGIWYLGLHINDSLRLEILLGIMPVGGDCITASKKLCTVDLDFHA